MPSRHALLAAGAHIVGHPLAVVNVLRPQTLRCRLEGQDRTVIVKGGRHPDDQPWQREARHAVAFFNDVAALQFLGEDGPGIVGVDPDAGVVVMPDLGDGPGLDHVLLHGTADEATAGLLQWAEALGRFHASTAGHRDTFAPLRDAYAPVPSSGLVQRLPRLCETLADLGVPVPEAELRQALDPEARPNDPLLHRDPCPDNLVVGSSRATLIDFEFCAYGPVGQDAAVLRMGMPTCWCAGTVPEPVRDAVEARYRQAVSVGIPVLATEGGFASAVADGGAHHLTMTLLWQLAEGLVEDRTFGEASLRQRVLARIDLCPRHPDWPGIAELLPRLHSVLHERWGAQALPPFPAYVSG